MIKIGVTNRSSIRLLANPLVRQNKSQFELNAEIDNNSWKDYKLNMEKSTFYDNKLV